MRRPFAILLFALVALGALLGAVAPSFAMPPPQTLDLVPSSGYYGAYGVAVDRQLNRVYVTSNAPCKGFWIIDGANNNTLSPNLAEYFGPNPYGVAVDPVTHWVYVTDWSDSRVRAFEWTKTPTASTSGFTASPTSRSSTETRKTATAPTTLTFSNSHPG